MAAEILSDYVINCTLARGNGTGLNVEIRRVRENGEGEGEEEEEEVVASLANVVSFTEPIDFREKFGRFVELGVGGLKREISELYRRAFASRGIRKP